jgi:uncharacterized protein
MSLSERLRAPGPKRMLALDGGGIRGAISVGFLEKMEQLLRERHGRPDLKLCEYFDLIGGTSTGAIIAGALAIGMDASQIKEMYLELGGRVFGRRQWRRWVALFSPEPLQEELERAFAFGNRTLGDGTIQTGLCIITKRVDTGSTWSLLNHPEAAFYRHNRSILLRDAIRSSTAAPVYFVPERFEVSHGETGAFVDGGVSMANNPALQLFLLATLRGFPFRWATGADQLLLVSVGTGVWREQIPVDVVTNSRLWNWASRVPAMLMSDASWQNQLILQYLSTTPTPWEINREVGDLAEDLLTPEPLLSYLRYNVWLDEGGLQEIGLAGLASAVTSLRDMSAARNRYDLTHIGEEAAHRQVKEEHFPHYFDLVRLPISGDETTQV